MLGSSNDKESTIRFFSRIYKNSPVEIKREILQSIKRMNMDSFHRFIDKHEVKNTILKYIQ